MAEQLRAVIDGVPAPQAEARALWERFSAHMEAHPGDVRGFAEREGHADAQVAVEDGAPTLTLRTREHVEAIANAATPPTKRRRAKGQEQRAGQGRSEADRRSPKPRLGRPAEAPGATRGPRPRRDGEAPRQEATGDGGECRRGSGDKARRPPRRDAASRPPRRGHDEAPRRPIDGDAPPRRPGGVIRREEAGTPQGVAKKRRRPRVVDAQPPRKKRTKD